MPARSKKNKQPNNGNKEVTKPKNTHIDWDNAISLVIQGHKSTDALVKSGASETYADTAGGVKLRKLVRKKAGEVIEKYNTGAKLSLLKLSEAECKLVHYLARDENYLELPKYAQTAKQIKQSAGVLADQPVTMQFIKVDQLIQTQNILAEQQNKPQHVDVIDVDNVKDTDCNKK